MKKLPATLAKFIIHFASPIKKYVWGLLLTMALLSAMVALDGYIAKYLIDSISSKNFSKNEILYFVSLFIIFWEVCNIGWRISEYLAMKILPVIKMNIIDSVTDHVINHSHRFFQENFSGSISNKISALSRGVASIIEISIANIFYHLMMVIFSITALYTVNPIFAAILACWFVSFMLVNLYFMKYMENYSNVLANSSATTFGKLVDIISNINNVKLFARRAFEVSFLRQSLAETKLHDINLHKYEMKVNYFKGLVCNVMIGAMVYYLCTLYVDNKITLGDFSLILMICSTISDEIWNLMRDIGRLVEEVGICNQALTLISSPIGIIDAKNAEELKVNKGEIEFKNVSFKYLKNDKLFDNLSIKIASGSKIGLVGYSGSGKSTFISLIVRAFDIYSGDILIDNKNIKLVTQDSLRRSISYIPQDPSLFHRTLMENIRYGRIEASDDEVINAAKLANAHEFIIKTEMGYNSLVGERGTKLSGGQRQRIAIARAILKNAPILILDEATSALDSHTEELIQDSLKTLMRDKTTIVIAHRLSTLLHMDRIIVLDKGRIVEDGSHNQLLELKGLYSKLWNSQISGFIVDNEEAIPK